MAYDGTHIISRFKGRSPNPPLDISLYADYLASLNEQALAHENLAQDDHGSELYAAAPVRTQVISFDEPDYGDANAVEDTSIPGVDHPDTDETAAPVTFSSYDFVDYRSLDDDIKALLLEHAPEHLDLDLSSAAPVKVRATRAKTLADAPYVSHLNSVRPGRRPQHANDVWQRVAETKELPALWDPKNASTLTFLHMIDYILSVDVYQTAMKKYREDCKAAKETNEEPPPKPTLPKPRPLGIRCTTGLGKSKSARLATMIANMRGIPLLLVARDHEAIDEYEKAGAFHYHGRSGYDPDPAKKQILQDWSCRNYSPVIKLAENNHRPAATLCREKCGFGQTYKLEKAKQKAIAAGKPAGESREFKDAVQWFRDHGKDQEEFPACEWQSHMEAARNSVVLAITEKSYSSSIAAYGSGENKVNRIVIIDEGVSLGCEIEIGHDIIDDWKEQTEKEIEYLARQITANQESAERELAKLKYNRYYAAKNNIYLDTKKYDEFNKLIEEKKDKLKQYEYAIAVFDKITDDLNRLTKAGSIQRVPDDTVKFLSDMPDQTNGIWSSSTAAWERVRFKHNDIDIEHVPLRAAASIALSILNDSGYYEGRRLHIVGLTGIGEDMCGGRPTLLLDATMPPETVEIIEANGGHILDITAVQNVQINRYLSEHRMHGRGEGQNSSKGQQDTAKLEISRAFEALRKLPRNKFGGRLLTHYNWLEYYYKEHELNPNDSTIKKLADEGLAFGYWGKHDVGQDKWFGCNMVIFGGLITRVEEQRQAYNVARMTALYAKANPANWPVWESDHGTDFTVWLDEGSGFKVKTRMPLHKNSKIQAWLMARYTASMIQTIGRPRAVWASSEDPIVINIFGGLPIDFAAYGIQVANYYLEEDVFDWRSHQQYNEDRAEECDNKFQLAVQRIIENKGISKRKISINKILKELDEMVHEGVVEKSMSKGTVCAKLKELKVVIADAFEVPELIEQVEEMPGAEYNEEF